MTAEHTRSTPAATGPGGAAAAEAVLSPRIARRPARPAVRWLLAVAAPAVALGLALALAPWLATRPFAFFFAAVFLAGWYGGFLPGLLSAAVSFVLLHLFLLEPLGAFAIRTPAEWVQNATFVGVSLLASWLSGTLRDAHGRALAAAEENALLAMRLQEQAVELEQQTEEAQSLTMELEDQVEEASRLRAELEDANERLTAILQTLTEGVVLASPDGEVTFANTAASRMLERLPATGPLRFDGQALRLDEATPVAAALRQGEPVAGAELLVHDSSGRLTALRMNAAPLRGGERAGGVVASFYDVTAEREAQNALRESEARFRTMADTAPVLVWVSGTDGLHTFFNRTWLEFTGRTMEQELANGWTEGVHPEDRERCIDVHQASLRARRAFVTEYRLRRADGEHRWLLDHGVPRFEPDGSFAGFIGSLHRHHRAARERGGAALPGRGGRGAGLVAGLRGDAAAPLPPGGAGDRRLLRGGPPGGRLHPPRGGRARGPRAGRRGRGADAPCARDGPSCAPGAALLSRQPRLAETVLHGIQRDFDQVADGDLFFANVVAELFNGNDGL